MNEQKTMTYQEALEQGKIKKGDYFAIKYPNGETKIFRLVKREIGYVMWGMPTKGEICLQGQEGYDKLLTLANDKVMEEYYLNSVFEEVHAVGLPEKEYTAYSWKELNTIFDKPKGFFNDPDDAKMCYCLASCCVYLNSSFANFYVFHVYSGNVYANSLYSSDGYTSSPAYAVRPEATPKATMKLLFEGCDGSKENPWICLGYVKKI